MTPYRIWSKYYCHPWACKIKNILLKTDINIRYAYIKMKDVTSIGRYGKVKTYNPNIIDTGNKFIWIMPEGKEEINEVFAETSTIGNAIYSASSDESDWTYFIIERGDDDV